MNRINQFNVEPGPYNDKDHQGNQAGANHGPKIVVTDIVTHYFNQHSNQFDNGIEPLVIVRDLVHSAEIHKRYAYPLSIFKQKFYKA